jgi:hypothetical protein
MTTRQKIAAAAVKPEINALNQRPVVSSLMAQQIVATRLHARTVTAELEPVNHDAPIARLVMVRVTVSQNATRITVKLA